MLYKVYQLPNRLSTGYINYHLYALDGSPLCRVWVGDSLEKGRGVWIVKCWMRLHINEVPQMYAVPQCSVL